MLGWQNPGSFVRGCRQFSVGELGTVNNGGFLEKLKPATALKMNFHLFLVLMISEETATVDGSVMVTAETMR